jgi:hypothetical protein
MFTTMTLKNISFLLVSLLCLSACDSGDILDQELSTSDLGRTVKLTATMSGVDSWDSKYAVSLAGFVPGDNYAHVVRTLPATTADGSQVELVLSNIDDEVMTVELAITNRLRERIITLARVNLEDYADNPDTIRMDLGHFDVSRFGALQMGLFDMACIQCHGGNGRSAAGLNLTAGNTVANLVDVPSTRCDGMMRVVSGDASASLLHQILAEGGESILGYNHTEVLSSQFKENTDEVRSLLDEWIERLKIED